MSGCKSLTTGPLRSASVMRLAAAAVFLAGAARTAASQTEYYNLDSNRPLRVEDALPTELRLLDIQLAPFRLENSVGGTRRWRVDPKLSYGVASLTEIEVRVPVLFVDPASRDVPAAIGLSSIGIGAMRAINTETAVLPAFAISAEALLPVGSMAPPKTSYAIKGLLTKTTSMVRVSLNGSYGTYSVIPAASLSASCRLLPPGAPGCDGRPSVPDLPCARTPVASTGLEAAEGVRTPRVPASVSSACLTAYTAATTSTPRSLGNRWFAGAAVDRTFALCSTLVAADVFAERLIGLSPLLDWTAEIGIRRQWSPQLVLDGGVSRHFAGTLPSTAVTFGATYAVSIWRR